MHVMSFFFFFCFMPDEISSLYASFPSSIGYHCGGPETGASLVTSVRWVLLFSQIFPFVSLK